MQLQSLKSPIAYGILLTVSFSIFVIYLIAGAKYLTDHDENTCDMTYMFEYPQYVRISLSSKDSDKPRDNLFPRFRLYAYGEGFITERLRKMHFSGIPVLFVPGNAGSQEQVRSIASVSLRKSLKSRTPFHFDYFTISFGKDYSALYGGVLKEETQFTAECIKKILSLYQGKVKKVILIGHSMGGIIAKGALLLSPVLNSNVASIVITLATPFKPSLYPDYTFFNYYQELNNLMERLKENGTTVISIGGGSRDILVPSSQTIDNHADLNVLTTSIPGVWRSTDHLCILWCKQLVLNIVRSLFDCVNTAEKPITIYESHEQRMKVFKWHFLERYSFDKRLPRTVSSEKIEFRKEVSEWIEDSRRQYVWSSKNYTQQKGQKPVTIYHMIKLDASIDTLSIDAIHLKTRDWLFACTVMETQTKSNACTWGWNLSNRTRVVPGLNKKPLKYSIDLDLNEIRALGASHVVVRIPAQTLQFHDKDEDEEDDDDDNQIIQVDAYLKSTRHKRFSSIKPWTTQNGALRYYVTLEGVTDVISVELKSLTCHNDNTHNHYASVELLEPWVPGSGQIQFFIENDDYSKIMKVQTVHSQRLSIMKSQAAGLRLSLDPACSYNIYVQRANLIERISCMIRDRWTFIYSITVGLLLLSIGHRIDSQSEDGTSITAIIIITTILCLCLNLVIECCVGIVILHLMAIGTVCSVVFFGSVAHNIAVRFLARAITFSTTWSDWLLGGLVNHLPLATSNILISMVPATCGALTMIISLFLHFLRLTRMYEDCLEELLFASMRHFNLLKKRNKEEESNESIRENILNELLLFLFWCFAAIPAIPTVLVWAKNFSFSSNLATEDSIFMYSWIVMVACGTSRLVKIPTVPVNSYKTKLLATLLRCLGWIALAITATSNASNYYWCIPPSLAIVVVLISAHSLLT